MDVYARAIKTYWELFGENDPGGVFKSETRLYTTRDDEAGYSLDLLKVMSSNPDDWFSPEKTVFEESLTHLAPGALLLDVGCGSGRISVAYMKKGFNVLAVDTAPELVDVCIQRGVNAEILDFKTATFKRNSYDGILAYLNVIPEISDNLAQFRTLIAKVLRTLKKGGILIFSSFEWDLTKKANQDYVAEHGSFEFKAKLQYLTFEEPYQTLYRIPMAYVTDYFDNKKWENLFTIQEGVFYSVIYQKR